jgi:phosphoribosylamine--glycine ligase
MIEADSMPDVKVFHSGTKMLGKSLATDGGRVLGVTALGTSVLDARKRAYAALGKINFEGMHYRKDIGHQALVTY